MAKENKPKGPDENIIIQAKDASIGYPVEVESLGKFGSDSKGDPYHNEGDKFVVGDKKAKELEARGWVKIIGPVKFTQPALSTDLATALLVLLMFMASFTTKAQLSVDLPLYNAGNTYVLANLAGATAVRDTVTSTATGFLTSKRVTGQGRVTIQALVTKVSGTVGGTLTLQGSLDGTNFDAIPTEETRTSIATQTAADATGSYTWRLKDSPYVYFRVSYVGGSGAVAYLNARILKH